MAPGFIQRGNAASVLDINLGTYGHSVVSKFGRNPAVGTGAYEDIWTVGGTYNWLQAAATVRIKAGGNAADDSGGAGAQKVMVVGLDENWAEAQEEITTNGESVSSATTTTFTRVFRAYVTDAGAYTGANTAAIAIETSGGTTVAQIAAGVGQSQLGLYTVPAGKTAYLTKLFINVSQVGNKQSNVRLWQRPNADDVSTPFSAKRLVDVFDELAGVLDVRQDSYPVFPAKTDIWFDAIADTSESVVDVAFDLTLVDV